MATDTEQAPARPELDRGRLRVAIEDGFTELALHPAREFHFISGAPLAERLDYSAALLEGIPEAAVASFSGVGNPFRVGLVHPGEVVLDVGCGSGMDLLIASRLVGPGGRAIGVDMTSAMVERAQQCVRAAGSANAQVMWGYAESLPLQDGSADVVLCNAVVSLTPDKMDTFRELRRVLRPGGRIHLADVVLDMPVPEEAATRVDLWTECVAGGTSVADYADLMREAGFLDVEIVAFYDVFEGTRMWECARRFGAKGANIRARV